VRQHHSLKLKGLYRLEGPSCTSPGPRGMDKSYVVVCEHFFDTNLFFMKGETLARTKNMDRMNHLLVRYREQDHGPQQRPRACSA
jgi:hypothetical protein